MKLNLVAVLIVLIFTQQQLSAQRNCSAFSYQQEELKKDPTLGSRWEQVETFTRQYITNNASASFRTVQGLGVIKIPVVVHILYHYPSENIDDALVIKQIEILNQCFRRQNADTIHTPSRFKPVAADCEIEFQLAVSDPRRRNTSGIVRKYTPIPDWDDSDKMKFSSEMGDDAWDAKSYFNIWVCDLDGLAGYASRPGAPANRDGIVIDFSAFSIGGSGGFDMGKTAVHETGHWLNLRHLWGDEYCGSDEVGDTPKQAGYNTDCPSGIQVTCSNGPTGDMYMNYMDFTNDACMNLFTLGQKERMRALFAAGGARSTLLNSTGLQAPLIYESPLPEESPRWLHHQLYPNPATTEMTLDLAYDVRWIGKIINVVNLQGQVVMQVPVASKIQIINISKLKPGMYFLSAKKEGGDFIQQKFVKL